MGVAMGVERQLNCHPSFVRVVINSVSCGPTRCRVDRLGGPPVNTYCERYGCWPFCDSYHSKPSVPNAVEIKRISRRPRSELADSACASKLYDINVYYNILRKMRYSGKYLFLNLIFTGFYHERAERRLLVLNMRLYP